MHTVLTVLLLISATTAISVGDAWADDDLGLHCYPNPAQIRGVFLTAAFKVETNSNVTLEIYTIDGYKVKTLLDNVSLGPTEVKTVKWAYRNNGGEKVDPGVYVAVLRISDPVNGGRIDKFVFVLE
ncbi:MAG: hypothetical protein JSW52_00800 [Candidatus Coatesbacteria bacterium]|nr:MAG: hypothetical protein JSW52_00800 [Candidatus Coatesbacteria bacterium]